MRAGTYDAKVNRNLNVTGLEHANVCAGEARVASTETAPSQQAAAAEPTQQAEDTNPADKHHDRKVH